MCTMELAFLTRIKNYFSKHEISVIFSRDTFLPGCFVFHVTENRKMCTWCQENVFNVPRKVMQLHFEECAKAYRAGGGRSHI